MISYQEIFDCAINRKGGEKNLEALIQRPNQDRKLSMISDDRCLAEFTKKIFQSGFVWKIVEKKWDGFEEVFWGFDIDKLLMMPEEMLERKAQDKRIIRNFRKIKTVIENAIMIKDTCDNASVSFAEFLVKWPKGDLVGLWLYLKENGSRLGGNTGPYALRALGLDCFLLTRDVEGFLRTHNIVETGITTKKALYASQKFFNELADVSGRNFSDLSRLIAYAYGENRV